MPPGAATVTSTRTAAQLTLTANEGALAQTIGFEYGASTAYGSRVAPTSGETVAAGNSDTATTVVDLSGLVCGTTYHYRFSSTTDDGAVNGITKTVDALDSTLTTADCRDGQSIGAVTFDPPTLTVGGTTTASASATSGLPVTFGSSTLDVCTVSGAMITGVAAGTCTHRRHRLRSADAHGWRGVDRKRHGHLRAGGVLRPQHPARVRGSGRRGHRP